MRCFDSLVRKWRPRGGGGGGGGCDFSPSGSNTKNKKLYTIFSQLNEYRPTSSEDALKSEVRAHHAMHRRIHRYETVSVDDAKPSTLSPSEMKTDPKLKTWCAGVCNRTRSGRVPEQV